MPESLTNLSVNATINTNGTKLVDYTRTHITKLVDSTRTHITERNYKNNNQPHTTAPTHIEILHRSQENHTNLKSLYPNSVRRFPKLIKILLKHLLSGTNEKTT